MVVVSRMRSSMSFLALHLHPPPNQDWALLPFPAAWLHPSQTSTRQAPSERFKYVELRLQSELYLSTSKQHAALKGSMGTSHVFGLTLRPLSSNTKADL